MSEDKEKEFPQDDSVKPNNHSDNESPTDDIWDDTSYPQEDYGFDFPGIAHMREGEVVSEDDLDALDQNNSMSGFNVPDLIDNEDYPIMGDKNIDDIVNIDLTEDDPVPDTLASPSIAGRDTQDFIPDGSGVTRFDKDGKVVSYTSAEELKKERDAPRSTEYTPVDEKTEDADNNSARDTSVRRPVRRPRSAPTSARPEETIWDRARKDEGEPNARSRGGFIDGVAEKFGGNTNVLLAVIVASIVIIGIAIALISSLGGSGKTVRASFSGDGAGTVATIYDRSGEQVLTLYPRQSAGLFQSSLSGELEIKPDSPLYKATRGGYIEVSSNRSAGCSVNIDGVNKNQTVRQDAVARCEL